MKMPKAKCKNCGHYIYYLGRDINNSKIWVHAPDLCLWCKHCDCKNPKPTVEKK